MTLASALAGLALFAAAVTLARRIDARLTRRATLRARSAVAAGEALQHTAPNHYLRNSTYEAWAAAHPHARRLVLSPA